MIAAAAVVLTLLHTGSPAPLPKQPTQPTAVAAANAATDGTASASSPTVTANGTAATSPSAAVSSSSVTQPPSAAQTAVDTAPPRTTAAAATAATAATAKPAVPTTSPAATLEPWQPFSTEPPEPWEPGVGDPIDPPLTHPPQPVWDGEIEIRITSASRFFSSSAVYIHLYNWQEGQSVWPIRSEQERLHFSAESADEKTAVYPGNGLIRQYDQYHLMVYDRRGQVQDFYFCIRPPHSDSVTVPERIVYTLE